MVFTAFQARRLHPEEVNPMAGAISKAMEGFGQGMKAAYLPQQIEADIFAKRFGPLATLATTPMFLQNPQFQEALGHLIAKNMGYGGMGGYGQGQEGEFPTYAGQVKKDVQEASGYASDLSKAGKAKTALSGAAGTAENYFGDTAKHFLNAFNSIFGTNINSGLAKEQNAFMDKINDFKNIAIQTHKLTPKDAEESFSLKKNETPQQGLNRMRKQNPWLLEQEQKLEDERNQQLSQQQQQQPQMPMDVEDERNQDNQELNLAADFSRQIQEKYGLDVPETLIFNYMQQRPGDIDLMDLLKTAGISDKQLKKAGLK